MTNQLVRTIVVATTALLVPSLGAAQTNEPKCGASVKEEVAKILDVAAIQKDPTSPEAMALQDEVYKKYSFCAADAQDIKSLPINLRNEYCGKLSYLGNTAYERMRCCGYDPQKMLFGCPVEIKLPYGFGSAPFPGSYENVLTCVDFGGGFVPVARDRVHLANAVSGSPNWYFAVIAKANERLAAQSLKGQTLVARSILSWALMPTDCGYRPYWGDIIDYQIRLDP